MRLLAKKKAIELRKSGRTYNEIRKEIPNLSKSTLSGWLRNISLTSEQQLRILAKIKNGAESSKMKGALTNKRKSLERIESLQLQAEQSFESLYSIPLFNVGLSLYWAEGSKKSRRFQFINSDPEMIKIMLKWLRGLFQVDNKDIRIRIYIHRVYQHENCELFWEKITNISHEKFLKTIYKPSKHQVKKNNSYKGCCRIEIVGSELFWKVLRWQEMLSKRI